jgi:hypothetical protein
MPAVEKYPAWRDGNALVLPRNSLMAPDRCIFTNDVVPERSKITRRLSWGHEGPAKWMPTKIKMLWALADMKFITVTFGLSTEARAIRYSTLVFSSTCLAIGIFLFVEGLRKGGVPPPMGYLGGGAALVIVALTLFINTYSVIDIVAVDSNYVWLRGAKKAFLDSLPSLDPNIGPNRISEPTPGGVAHR